VVDIEQLPAGVIGNPAPITIDAQPVPTSIAVGPDVSNYGDSNTVSSSQPGEIVKVTGLS
jgi:hypothetical protein